MAGRVNFQTRSSCLISRWSAGDVPTKDAGQVIPQLLAQRCRLRESHRETFWHEGHDETSDGLDLEDDKVRRVWKRD